MAITRRVGVDGDLEIRGVAVVLGPLGEAVVAGWHQGATHDRHLADPAAPY